MCNNEEGGVETREDKIRNNGRGNIDSVPLGVKATADLMPPYPYPYPAEEQPTNKRNVQNIRRRSTRTETVSRLVYHTRDCSHRSQE